MANLFDILAAGVQGVDRGLDARRQMQRQAEYDQLQKQAADLQKEQFSLTKLMTQNQLDTNTYGLLRSGTIDAPTARQRLGERAPGMAQVPVKTQAPVVKTTPEGRKFSPITEDAKPIMGQLTVMRETDPLAGLYNVDRQNTLADRQAQVAADAERDRLQYERQLAILGKQAEFNQTLARLNARLQPQTTPTFSAITDSTGQLHAFNQRNGTANPMGLYAQDKTKPTDPAEAARKDIEATIPSQTLQMAYMMPEGPIARSVRTQLRAIAKKYGLPEGYYDAAFSTGAQATAASAPWQALQAITASPNFPKN